MSDDFVKRLRRYADVDYAVWHPWVYSESADRIEAQAARIAELEAALKNSADALREAGCNFAWAVANAALEGGKKDE